MNIDLSFEEYLISKKIDKTAFENADRDLYQSWKKEFEDIHPESFTMQKKFFLNKIRRKFPVEPH
jgi:hypothetical protein